MSYRTAFPALLILLLFPWTARADLLFDIGIKQTYEDNINGAPGGATRNSDHYTTLFAAIGGYAEIAEATTYLILRLGVEGYSYATYDALDGGTGALNLRLYHRSGELLSSHAIFRLSDKDFKDDQRDSVSGAAALEFKQDMAEWLWLKEGYEYERNNARADLFTYNGHTAGVWAGIKAAPTLFLGIGYSYILRTYEDAARYRSETQTVTVMIEYRLSRTLFAYFKLDRRRYDTRNPSSRFDNTVSSIGLTYSY